MWTAWRVGSTAGLLAALLAAAVAYGDESTMNAEIDYLLETVAGSDCVFIRNGDEHDATAARDHLQMKRERGRRYYDSTEQFIERIASRSSWSGKDYRIRCGAEPEQAAGDWFTAVLQKYRSAAAQ